MDCKEKMIICKWKLTGTKGIGSLYMDECQGSVVFRFAVGKTEKEGGDYVPI